VHKHHLKGTGINAFPTAGAFFFVNIIDFTFFINGTFGTGFGALATLRTNEGTKRPWFGKFRFNTKRGFSWIDFIIMINGTNLPAQATAGASRFFYFNFHQLPPVAGLNFICITGTQIAQINQTKCAFSYDGFNILNGRLKIKQISGIISKLEKKLSTGRT
jgi:hypothetical protein